MPRSGQAWIRGVANLETTVGVLMGCAAEQEAAGEDVLSIRGVGNVLRLVGQVWELMGETVCVVCPSGLGCSGLFSLLLTHREKDKAGFLLVGFLLLNLKTFLKRMSMHILCLGGKLCSKSKMLQNWTCCTSQSQMFESTSERKKIFSDAIFLLMLANHLLNLHLLAFYSYNVQWVEFQKTFNVKLALQFLLT